VRVITKVAENFVYFESSLSFYEGAILGFL